MGWKQFSALGSVFLLLRWLFCGFSAVFPRSMQFSRVTVKMGPVGALRSLPLVLLKSSLPASSTSSHAPGDLFLATYSRGDPLRTSRVLSTSLFSHYSVLQTPAPGASPDSTLHLFSSYVWIPQPYTTAAPKVVSW